MVIKNIHSSMGRLKKYMPEMYSGLNPHTPILVNPISQGIKMNNAKTIPAERKGQYCLKFTFLSKDKAKGITTDKMFIAR